MFSAREVERQHVCGGGAARGGAQTDHLQAGHQHGAGGEIPEGGVQHSGLQHAQCSGETGIQVGCQFSLSVYSLYFTKTNVSEAKRMEEQNQLYLVRPNYRNVKIFNIMCRDLGLFNLMYWYLKYFVVIFLVPFWFHLY